MKVLAEKTEEKKSKICGKQCEVFSRIVGYYRPINLWNAGKKEEFRQRKAFVINEKSESNGN